MGRSSQDAGLVPVARKMGGTALAGSPLSERFAVSFDRSALDAVAISTHNVTHNAGSRRSPNSLHTRTARPQVVVGKLYVRQSSVNQVTHNSESTDLQYNLVERAIQLDWPPERVVVIDDDLGKSGGSSDERRGFQRLIAEIGLGHAGLVVSLDGSRLARNNADWHRLLELCGLFGTLLADAERVMPTYRRK